jgi:hypothetical protein
MPLFKGGLVDIKFVRIDCALSDIFSQAEGSDKKT